MISVIRSIWIWFSVGFLLLLWCVLLGIIRLFDRDEVRYRTGRWFRRLGAAMVKANPTWTLNISGFHVTNPRRPYLVVCNHQSLADVPLISCLPWEMKWMAKAELFRLPVVGSMMKMAGDIPVERGDRRKAAQALIRAKWYLKHNCSVMFFPEGTRSPDGRIHKFNDGAFLIAIQEQVPILPLVIEGSFSCLPKKSWIYGEPSEITLKVLEPVETKGLTSSDVEQLSNSIRQMMVNQIAAWRNTQPSRVDANVTIAEHV